MKLLRNLVSLRFLRGLWSAEHKQGTRAPRMITVPAPLVALPRVDRPGPAEVVELPRTAVASRARMPLQPNCNQALLSKQA